MPDTLAILNRYIETFNREDVDGLAAMYAERTDYRQPLAPGPMTTPAEVHAFESQMFGGFHDVHVELQWSIAGADEVAAGLTVAATHDESGTRIAIDTAEHLRVDGDGRIVEHTRYTDSAAFLSQLQPGATASM